MISYLSWKIVELWNSRCSILTVSWVWYEVLISENTFVRLALWENIELYIYHNITENSQNLFWFFDVKEKELFLELTKVSWVWGKSALNILDLWYSQIFEAIIWEDTVFLSQAKWIWKKMAEKIIVELKDKDFLKLNYVQTNTSQNQNKQVWNNSVWKQIKTSLIAMWYNSFVIDEAFRELPEGIEKLDEILTFMIRKMN